MEPDINVKDLIDKSVDVVRKLYFEGRLIEAKGITEQILKCDPEEQYAKQMLGLIEHKAGRHRDAIGVFSELIKEHPENADNYNNIALAYSCVSDFPTAIDFIKKAIDLRPETSCFYNNLGLQFRHSRNYPEAIKYFSKATELDPKDKMSWTNLGSCYGECRNFDKSNKAFEKSLDIDPEYPMAHVDYAYNLQFQGRWKEAASHYEYRFDQFHQFKNYKKMYDPIKKWDGKQNLEGKKYLVFCEQGLGDALMFARYIRYLKAKGAYTIIHCYDVLETIMKKMDGVDETTTAKIQEEPFEKLPDYDFHSSIMSLPFLLEKYNPFYEKYLSFNGKANLANYSNTFNIGIIWAGSPLHPDDPQRSVFLKEFKIIHDIPGVKLFNLQKNCNLKRKYIHQEKPVDYTEGADDMKIVDCSELIYHFEDLAMFINGLDLIISCDTAVVHLAGALEKPVFMATAYNSDPRWMTTGETTDWYPTLRIFRQEERGDWKNAFERIAAEVENLLPNKR